MEYGRIVLANTKKGLVPAAIRFFTKSKFSHSLITVPDLIDVPMCIEAAEYGIDTLRFDTGYLQNPDVEIEIWEVHLPKDQIDAGIKAALDKLETGYGYLELPWFAWRWLNAVFGKDIKHQDNWCKNGTICSQLCELYLNETKRNDLFDDFGKGSVSPSDLRAVMVANPEYFTKRFSNMST
jgi:hypothetical protein